MSGSLLPILAALIGFMVLHSFAASSRCKRKALSIAGPSISERYVNLFSLLAGISILPVVYLVARDPGEILYIVPKPWIYLMLGGQAITAVLTVKAFRDAWPEKFALIPQLSAPTPGQEEVLFRGIYGYVRDPFAGSGLAIMWLTPFMTAHLLAVYIAASVYVYLGSLHWEGRLIAQFGQAYLDYMDEVPRILPRLGRLVGRR
ncbi:MAG: isoprenylcysteine carboxylmethyltransferase family protein [Methanotrichaceae archaeon]|nr:isoprenylcysteine carboxylmethyltransferase family protein [Methanotrichaceae archaeon]